ncbi:MAG: hypothetical protein ABSH41_22700 [Syntrophobacteraceae bacterium]
MKLYWLIMAGITPIPVFGLTRCLKSFPTHSASTTCAAMYGSGVRTGMAGVGRKMRLIRHGRERA